MSQLCNGGDGLCSNEAEADGYCDEHHPFGYGDDSEVGPQKLLGDPARLAEQMCICGHSRLGHASGFMECIVLACSCRRYTWRPEEPKPKPQTCYACDDPATTTGADGLQLCKYHGRPR